MIKLFRKIRQNLLSEGKTGKYFKYAIGEIVLVMIGILLALQVNNWNEERKNISIRKSYLENLKVDLKEDLENLERLNTINTSAETEGFYLADFLDNNLVEVDTLRLMKSIIFTGYIPNLTVISATYNDLINSNNIYLFNDVALKRLLDDYYIRNNWAELFKNRILKTAWYDYRDEMSKFHSPLLNRDYFAGNNSIELNYSWKYKVEWNEMKNNKYLKTQIGLIGAYRLLLRNDLAGHIKKAKTILKYLEN
jgi:hypothetical protein